MTASETPEGAADGTMSPGLFAFAAVAVSLGLSDVWRFPHLLAEHASPWFPALYLGALLLIGVPLMVAELALARLGHSRPSSNYGFTLGGDNRGALWQYTGIVILVAVFVILSYASVVAGWMVSYSVRASIGGLSGVSTGAARLMFQSLITDPERLLGWHTLFMVGLGWVAARGVNAGTGRISRILVAAVFFLAAVLAAISLYRYGARSLLAMDWSSQWTALSGALVVDAVTQAFFTLGVCMGAILVLGHYLPRGARPGGLVMSVVAADILFVSLAAAGVLPLLFAADSPGAGLSFAVETLPVALSEETLGGLFLGLFYFLLFLLVATTAVVLMEVLVSWLCEKSGRTRAAVTPLAAAAVWVGGVLALLSFSALSFDFEFVGEERSYGLFDVMDILSSQILLPVIGVLMAVFVGWNVDKNKLKEALGDSRAVTVLHFLKRYVVPAMVAAILVALVFGRVLSRV
ncbi:MAG TPA: hypothetical protein VK973_13825 [Arenicellales bacterium]|nr:hypothetical protein [Arenicellales bacterium]